MPRAEEERLHASRERGCARTLGKASAGRAAGSCWVVHAGWADAKIARGGLPRVRPLAAVAVRAVPCLVAVELAALAVIAALAPFDRRQRYEPWEGRGVVAASRDSIDAGRTSASHCKYFSCHQSHLLQLHTHTPALSQGKY